MKISRDLIAGIVFSQFHAKIGPAAVVWMPSGLAINVRELISLKSIDIMVGEHGMVPKSLAIIPFPSIDLKGIVKCFEIKDEMHRGGVIDSAITLLFGEANDPIFYKYLNNFDEIFNETADKLKKVAKEDKPVILGEIERFYQDISTLLEELHEAEISTQEPESFPMEEEEEKEITGFRFKIIVCGDPRVGKTTTVLRFTDRAFRRTYIPTIGVNISEKQIRHENSKIQYIIWDIAGQSKFQRSRIHFYKGANGQVLVFDLTRPETFHDIAKWHQDIKTHLTGDLKGIILGNKSDLVDQRKVNQEEILKLANQLNLEYFETSAFSGENIDAAFQKLGEILIAYFS